jgi:uncharacterized cupredoxin-like copper-binding protein
MLAPVSRTTAGLAVAAVACGDGNDKAAGAVEVTLGEWLIEPDPSSAAAGEVTFAIKNDGEEEHEFVILKTDLAPDAFPTAADGSVDEEGAGVAVVDEIEEIAAGDSAELAVELEAGKYVLICNLVEEMADGTTDRHYEEGMHAQFTVQ